MKPKVLFVYPDYNYLPISPAYVIPVFKKYNIDFDYIDLHRNPDLVGTLRRGNYTHIATTGLVLDYVQVNEVFQEARSIDPSIGTILGGRISACPDHILERMPVDFVVVEDADPTLGELMKAIEEEETDFSSVASIAYRKNGSLVRTEMRKHHPLKNFDAAWEDVDMDYYIPANLNNNFWVEGFPIISGLGCVGKCTFCAPGIRGIRTRPVGDIIREMKWANERYYFNYYCFISEVFYPSVKDMREFCEAYKRSGLNKPWVCNMRADFNPELLDIVADAGCKYIFVGIESFDDKSLRMMGKNTTEKLLRNFIQRALDNGLQVMTGVMAGNLGDTPESIEKTVDFLIKMELISYGISSLFVYPGTKVYHEAVQRGVISDEFDFCDSFFKRKWDTSIDGPNYANVSQMNIDDLREAFHHERYRIEKYMTRKFIPGPLDVLKMEIECRECGHSFELNRGGAEMYICPKCLGINQVNIFFRMLLDHPKLDQLKTIVKNAMRVVVIGSNYYVKVLMWIAEEMGANPDDVVFIGGGFHMQYERNNISFDDIDETDTVLIGGLTLPEKVRQRLIEKGIFPNRIFNGMTKDCRRYFEISAHGKDIIYPDTFKEDVRWFGEFIAKKLDRECGLEKKWIIAPAGAFGIAICQGFMDAGLKVVAMLDSYKQLDDVGIGISAVHPRNVQFLGADALFIATPSPDTQDELGDSIVKNYGLDAKNVFKLKDIYRKYWDSLFGCFQ